MSPDSYTELFFLDEATALSAGHRPCAECRRGAYNEFKAAFVEVQAERGLTVRTAAEMDKVLHRERTARARSSTLPQTLPNGAMIALGEQAWVKVDDALRLWTPSGYTDQAALPGHAVELLTPPSSVAVLLAGYAVDLHVSARAPSSTTSPFPRP